MSHRSESKKPGTSTPSVKYEEIGLHSKIVALYANTPRGHTEAVKHGEALLSPIWCFASDGHRLLAMPLNQFCAGCLAVREHAYKSMEYLKKDLEASCAYVIGFLTVYTAFFGFAATQFTGFISNLYCPDAQNRSDRRSQGLWLFGLLALLGSFAYAATIFVLKTACARVQACDDQFRKVFLSQVMDIGFNIKILKIFAFALCFILSVVLALIVFMWGELFCWPWKEADMKSTPWFCAGVAFLVIILIGWFPWFCPILFSPKLQVESATQVTQVTQTRTNEATNRNEDVEGGDRQSADLNASLLQGGSSTGPEETD